MALCGWDHRRDLRLAGQRYLLRPENIMGPGRSSLGTGDSGPLNEEFYKGAGWDALLLAATSSTTIGRLVYGAMIGWIQVVEKRQLLLDSGGGHDGGQLAAYWHLLRRVGIAGLYAHVVHRPDGFGRYGQISTCAPRAEMDGVCALALLSWTRALVWTPRAGGLMGRSPGWFVLALIIKGLPFLIFLLILGVISRRRERRAFDLLIASEVGTDVLSQGEIEILRSGRRRRRALRRTKAARGPQARSLLKRLQREQMNLANLHNRTHYVSERLWRPRETRYPLFARRN